MSFFRPRTRPVTADARREISCFALKKAGGFERPTRFSFQHIETDRDYIQIFTPSKRSRPPEIVAVNWLESLAVMTAIVGLADEHRAEALHG